MGNAGAALSGGQRQKMGIARALLSEAQYMIFDEATSSVDPQSEREIWETIAVCQRRERSSSSRTECPRFRMQIVFMYWKKEWWLSVEVMQS